MKSQLESYREIAFTYLIMLAAELSVTKNKLSSGYNNLFEIFKGYNTNPTISNEKAKILTFYVTVGNGHKGELLILWGGFKFDNIGKLKTFIPTNELSIKDPLKLISNHYSIDLENQDFKEKLEKLKTLKIKTNDDNKFVEDTNNSLILSLFPIQNFDENKGDIELKLKNYFTYISNSFNHIYSKKIKVEDNNNKGFVDEDIERLIERLSLNLLYFDIISKKWYGKGDRNGYLYLNLRILTDNFDIQPYKENYNYQKILDLSQKVEKELVC